MQEIDRWQRSGPVYLLCWRHKNRLSKDYYYYYSLLLCLQHYVTEVVFHFSKDRFALTCGNGLELLKLDSATDKHINQTNFCGKVVTHMWSYLWMVTSDKLMLISQTKEVLNSMTKRSFLPLSAMALSHVRTTWETTLFLCFTY